MRALRGIAAGVAIAAAATAAGAADFLGDFRPVAAEDGARALWVNPAAIGLTDAPAAAADLVWYGEDRLRIDDARRLSLAVSTPAAAYGVQWDLAKETGVPDWTIGLGKRFPLARLDLGFTIEWRGGEDSALDGTAGLAFPVGREWRLAGVGTHLFEPETQGVKARQRWQVGAAWRPAALLGRLTYDAVFQDGDDEHWFGLAFDRTNPLRFGGMVDVDGNWSLSAGVVIGSHVVGGGAREPGRSPRREFAVWEWAGRPRRVPVAQRSGIGR